LNDAEETWIRDCLNQARRFTQSYVKEKKSDMLDPVVLDLAIGGWLVQWQMGKAPEDPNTVVNVTGLAFGQWLVDCLGMKWTVVTDATGTDMGVRHGPLSSQVLVFPTHVVAKRLEAREAGFFEKLYQVISTQISALK
jgi:hypothetical protein